MLMDTTLAVSLGANRKTKLLSCFVDPEKRIRGSISYIGLLTLLVCTLLNAITKIGLIAIF